MTRERKRGKEREIKIEEERGKEGKKRKGR